MPQGRLTTYDLPVGVIVDMDPLISQLSPFDLPLLNGDGGVPAIPRDSVFEKKVEWLDDTIMTPRSTVSGALTTGTTALVIHANEANHFGVGDILLLANDEFVRVTALAADGVTLTVTRAVGGSTATNVADASLVLGLGKTLPEGSDPEIARSRDRNARYNLTQIFGPEKVEVSMTENVIRKYGITTNEFDYQATQRMREKAIELEQALLYGRRFEDTTNKFRAMGGLTQYITTNVDSTTTTLTDTALLDMLETVFTAGGQPTDILVGAAAKRTISTFESSILQRDTGSNERGVMVDTFLSDFGTVRVRLDRWVRPNDLFIIDRNDLELGVLRPWQFEMLAKTGDSMKGQVVGEFTLKVKNASHHARFTALT